MRYTFLFLTIIFAIPSLTFGQFDINTSIGSLGTSIDIKPKNPEPGDTFTATINDYSLTGNTSAVLWKLNGTNLEEYANQRSITIKAPTSSEPLLLQASLEQNGGNSIILQKEIKPIFLDLIVEPQTRTPAFFEGRGLPSIASMVNVTAVLDDELSPKDLIYTWTINNKVLDGGPLRGKNTATFKTPPGQVFLAAVEISKINGEFVSSKTIQVRSFSPEMYFYEKNTLYGVVPKPITNFDLIGSSATLIAEPYNLSLNTYNHPDLLEWEVDGKKVTIEDGNPYEITLARPNGVKSGSSDINFHVRNLTDLLSGAKGNFGIKF